MLGDLSCRDWRQTGHTRKRRLSAVNVVAPIHLSYVYLAGWRGQIDPIGIGVIERDTIKQMTTPPRILDGIAIANEIKTEVAVEVKALAEQGITPGLAVILVGDVPASQIYVRSKVKTCGELGIFSEMLTPPETITTGEMLALVEELNARDDIDGILIQLPLPKHVDTKRLLEAVAPDKDVDGFHPVNVGRLQSGQPGLAPCTPAGIMEILRRSGLPIAGLNAVVVGRSDIVGKPAAMMLLNASATVTVCHSKTADLPKFTRAADILVAAIGRPGFVTAGMVKPGATLIDVGINRITDPAEVEEFFPGDAKRAETFAKRGSVVVGDIHPAGFASAGAYTPVPGGVGALTIAMLMQNTVTAAKLRRGISTERR
jgi:methylenetetrahydrofolate dehydrogenase (NADP+) / methenyltetrahydrofolate cyclohydrolase